MQLDENMDGYLSYEDLKTALTSSEGGLNLGCSEREVRAMLAAADTDGDALVSYAEFIDFLSVKDVEKSYSPFFDGACAHRSLLATDDCFLPSLLSLSRDSLLCFVSATLAPPLACDLSIDRSPTRPAQDAARPAQVGGGGGRAERARELGARGGAAGGDAAARGRGGSGAHGGAQGAADPARE